VAEEDLKKKKKKKKAKKHLLPEVKKRAKHMGLLQKNMSSIAINQHGGCVLRTQACIQTASCELFELFII